MDHEKDLLIDFETKDVEKSRYFFPLVCLFFFYIILLAFFTFFDLRPNLRIRNNIEWELVFLIIGFPLVGIVLLVKKKKFGWAICLLYNVLTMFSFIEAFLQPFLKNGFRDFEVMDGLGTYIILLITSTLIGMLISRDVRYYLKVSNTDLRDTLIISLLLSLAVVVVFWIS